MFTPNQERAAAEMIRVCRLGGKIGMANWTPDGFIGQLVKTLGKHVAPPAGVKSPALWGTRAGIEELFKGQASVIGVEHRAFAFRYRSPHHFLPAFRTHYGPVLKSFDNLGAAAQVALERDILALISQFNRSGDGTMVVSNEYLEIVIVRR
jgi:hypothetical protein